MFGLGQDAVFEGAKMANHALQLELVHAADALERAAYVLRDKAAMGAEANCAMNASRRARQAAGQIS